MKSSRTRPVYNAARLCHIYVILKPVMQKPFFGEDGSDNIFIIQIKKCE